MDLFGTKYKDCKITKAKHIRYDKKRKYVSREVLVGKICHDDGTEEEFEFPLWRDAETGEKVFLAWWELAEKECTTAIECYLEASKNKRKKEEKE